MFCFLFYFVEFIEIIFKELGDNEQMLLMIEVIVVS